MFPASPTDSPKSIHIVDETPATGTQPCPSLSKDADAVTLSAVIATCSCGSKTIGNKKLLSESGEIYQHGSSQCHHHPQIDNR